MQLLEVVLETDEGKSSLEFDELPPLLLDALTFERLISSRLSSSRCFPNRLHLLETIQWIEHMAHFAQRAGAAGTLVRALGSLGAIYHELSQPRIAARCYERAAALAESAADPASAAAACSGAGLAYDALARAALGAAPQGWAAFSRIQTQAVEVSGVARAACAAARAPCRSARPLGSTPGSLSGGPTHCARHRADPLGRPRCSRHRPSLRWPGARGPQGPRYPAE